MWQLQSPDKEELYHINIVCNSAMLLKYNTEVE